METVPANTLTILVPYLTTEFEGATECKLTISTLYGSPILISALPLFLTGKRKPHDLQILMITNLFIKRKLFQFVLS